MRRLSYLVLFIFLVACQQISIAAVWIDDDLNIISDYDPLEPQLPYEVYLGYMSTISLGEAGGSIQTTSPSLVSQVESSRYPSYHRLQTIGDPIPGSDSLVKLGQISGLHVGGIYVLHDSSHELIGTYSNMMDAYAIAYIGESYQVGVNESVELDGYCINNPGYTGWVAGADYSNQSTNRWSIEGEIVPQNVSYEYLTNNLGLSAGTYDLKLDVDYYYGYIDGEHYVFDDHAFTTITIVPEPATLLLLGFGGFLLRRRMA